MKWPGDAQNQTTTFGGVSRSALMSSVRSRGNATTEQRLAGLLRTAHLSGWRRHQPLLGRPDFIWRRQKVAVFVDGCFWHGHECGRNLTPKTNAHLWREKIRRNKNRDRRVTRKLRQLGWKVCRIWECDLAANPQRCVDKVRLLFLPRQRVAEPLADIAKSASMKGKTRPE